jgi:hypothetical protein
MKLSKERKKQLQREYKETLKQQETEKDQYYSKRNEPPHPSAIYGRDWELVLDAAYWEK